MSDKIDKLFYSFIFEGETRQSSYQIVFYEQEILDPDQTKFEKIKLREGRYLELYRYDDRFLRKLFTIDPLEINPFLEYHLEKYRGNKEDFIEKINLLFSTKNTIDYFNKYNTDLALQNANHSHIFDHTDGIRRWREQFTTHISQKLKWKGTPSQFGHIFYELAKKGFIDTPMWRGQINKSELARICWGLFEIKSKSIENLAKELSADDNSLTHANKELIKIPHISELS